MNVKTILKESIWIYIFVFIAAIAGYLVRALYARSFTVLEYGLFYAVFSLIFLFRPLRELGFRASQIFYINKFLAEKEYPKAKGVFIIALIPQIILSLIVAAVIFFLKPILVNNFFRDPLANIIINILLIYFIIQPVIFSLADIFGGFQKHLIFQLRDHLITIFVFIFSLLYLKLNFSLLTAPLSYLSAGILVLFVYIFFYKTKLEKFRVKAQIDKKTTKKVFSYAFVVSIGGFAWIILTYMDTLLITWIKGLESAGFYNVVLPSLQVISLIINPALILLFPIATNLFHNKEKIKLSLLISFVYNNFLIFTLPFVLILFVYSREIINFIFSAKYVTASFALKIYLLFWVFVFLRQVNFTFLTSIGEAKYNARILWVGIIFNFIADLILIWIYDYIGAIIATGLGFLLMTILTYNYLKKKLTIKIDYKQQYKIVLSGVLFIISALFLENILFIPVAKWGIVFEGLIVFSTSSIFYTLSLVLLNVITKEKIIYLKRLLFQKAS